MNRPMPKWRRYFCASILGITSPVWLSIGCVFLVAFLGFFAVTGIIASFFDQD